MKRLLASILCKLGLIVFERHHYRWRTFKFRNEYKFGGGKLRGKLFPAVEDIMRTKKQRKAE